MIGFAFGIACLLGLRWALRGGRCGSWGRRSYYGRGRCGRSRGFGRFRRGWGWRSRLWDMFEYLDTSPGQEKVIRAEIAKLMDEAHGAKRAWRRSADHLARAMSTESFDESSVDQAFEAQDASLRELRQSVKAAMARIHDALDPGQRERLAEIFGDGMFDRGPQDGPYR